MVVFASAQDDEESQEVSKFFEELQRDDLARDGDKPSEMGLSAVDEAMAQFSAHLSLPHSSLGNGTSDDDIPDDDSGDSGAPIPRGRALTTTTTSRKAAAIAAGDAQEADAVHWPN